MLVGKDKSREGQFTYKQKDLNFSERFITDAKALWSNL